MTFPFLKTAGSGITLEVTVQPRSSTNRIKGVHNGRLKVQVGAPPEDGKANEAVIELLAKIFKVPKRAISIMRGESSRQKTLEIAAPLDSIQPILDDILGSD